MNENGISRREFLAGATASAFLGASLKAETGAATSPLQEFDYDQVELTAGPLHAQYEWMRRYYRALNDDSLLKPYRELAGLPAPGIEYGGWYGHDGFVAGHTLGQYISGLARMARTTGDPACADKVRALVEGFAATVRAKGKIFAGPSAEKIWPCYILDKHLAGLIDAWQCCGLEQGRALLPEVYRAGLPFMPARGRDRIGKKDPPYDETFIMPETLFAACEVTGDRVYRDRAVAYLLDREFFDPLARGVDVLPGSHAYSHAIALSSAGKAHLILKDEKYLRAMQFAWKQLTETQQYASGGWGPNETFITPHRGELYDSLTNTVDNFETPCGSYAAIKLDRYLLCATGEARYGDNLERVVYNALLAVRNPNQDGDFPYYSTYGPRATKTYYKMKWPCCSGTLIEGVADYVKNIYFRAPDGIAVNLFTPSRVHWKHHGRELALEQKTGYPYADTVALYLDCAVPTLFAVHLRLPGWLQQRPTVRVNGAPVPVVTEKGFAVARRVWKRGDVLTVKFAQPFRLEAIDDRHPETVAVLHGPLLCVEENPAGGAAKLEAPDGWRAEGSGRYTSVSGRKYRPFHGVVDESYTTYFEKI
jgi:uncharacterized protein